MAEKNHTITHDADSKRYLIHVGGDEAGFAEYRDKGNGVREFFHTVIHPAYRGKGLSKQLIGHALDHTVDAGHRIEPTCSAVDHYIAANPVYGASLFRTV